ncbi:MAG TPA: AI-2E family transporter [Gemmatimonadaceae bacterium]|nr:AI-2E family transporter [Gemmatimonadaceae bacterium]
MAEPIKIGASDRRRLERRDAPTLAELTLPELRRMMVTTMLFVIILVLFLWMVRTVIIATILGVIVAMYMRPVYLWILRFVPNRIASATLTLLLLIGPALVLTGYSYEEIADVASYASVHRDEIATRIDQSLHRLPFLQAASTKEAVQHYVAVATNYGTNILGSLKSALTSLAVAATIFIFTSYYVMVDADEIVAYIRQRIPPRYGELSTALEANMRGVLYGAIYSTFLTQTIKSVIILAMNLVFHVPLAGVLAILSFIIGFFPIVGSWTVYLPVAAWLAVFRDAPGQALAMVLIGFVVNTVYISTFMRPKIAAARSKVLNFYWMLVALVTGVYTFGLVGILLGPLLIGLLKAILDTITSQPAWQWSDAGGDAGRVGASEL